MAALGHLWGPNEQRGLYRTRDGGASWQKVLGVDANTGAVDVAIDADGRTLFAATYQRRRRAWGFVGGRPGSALWRSLDGGDIGRIGIDLSRSDPNVLYVVLEHRAGGVFRSDDRGATWRRQNALDPRPSYYSEIRVDPKNADKVWVLGTPLAVSIDGGRTFMSDSTGVQIHVDHHALWIDPSRPEHMMLGNDGGVYFTYDGARHWDFIDNLPHRAVRRHRHRYARALLDLWRRAGQRHLGRSESHFREGRDHERRRREHRLWRWLPDRGQPQRPARVLLRRQQAAQDQRPRYDVAGGEPRPHAEPDVADASQSRSSRASGPSRRPCACSPIRAHHPPSPRSASAWRRRWRSASSRAPTAKALELIDGELTRTRSALAERAERARQPQPAVPAAVDSAVRGAVARTDSLKAKFKARFNSPSTRALDLLGFLEGSSAAPTEAQRRTLEQLTVEITENVAMLNDLIARTMPALRRAVGALAPSSATPVAPPRIP